MTVLALFVARRTLILFALACSASMCTGSSAIAETPSAVIAR